MKNRFDLIIFDWDGTLVDSIDWIVHCIQQAAMEFDFPVPDSQAAKDIIGLSIENAMLQLFPDVDENRQQLLIKHYADVFFSRQIGPDDLFPGVNSMLDELKTKGYKLAVATGKKANGLRQAIQATGVNNVFCTTRSADQTESKPSPLMINEIICELGIEKHRTLMIGDSIHDLQMAINAGVNSVGVCCGAHSAQVLQAYDPIMCLPYPTDLLDYL